MLEEYPEVASLTLSHEVMPRGPEFERTSTTGWEKSSRVATCSS